MKLFQRKPRTRKTLNNVARGGGAIKADRTLTVISAVPIAIEEETTEKENKKSSSKSIKKKQKKKKVIKKNQVKPKRTKKAWEEAEAEKPVKVDAPVAQEDAKMKSQRTSVKKKGPMSIDTSSAAMDSVAPPLMDTDMASPTSVNTAKVDNRKKSKSIRRLTGKDTAPPPIPEEEEETATPPTIPEEEEEEEEEEKPLLSELLVVAPPVLQASEQVRSQCVVFGWELELCTDTALCIDAAACETVAPPVPGEEEEEVNLDIVVENQDNEPPQSQLMENGWDMFSKLVAGPRPTCGTINPEEETSEDDADSNDLLPPVVQELQQDYAKLRDTFTDVNLDIVVDDDATEAPALAFGAGQGFACFPDMCYDDEEDMSLKAPAERQQAPHKSEKASTDNLPYDDGSTVGESTLHENGTHTTWSTMGESTLAESTWAESTVAESTLAESTLAESTLGESISHDTYTTGDDHTFESGYSASYSYEATLESRTASERTMSTHGSRSTATSTSESVGYYSTLQNTSLWCQNDTVGSPQVGMFASDSFEKRRGRFFKINRKKNVAEKQAKRTRSPFKLSTKSHKSEKQARQGPSSNQMDMTKSEKQTKLPKSEKQARHTHSPNQMAVPKSEKQSKPPKSEKQARHTPSPNQMDMKPPQSEKQSRRTPSPQTMDAKPPQSEKQARHTPSPNQMKTTRSEKLSRKSPSPAMDMTTKSPRSPSPKIDVKEKQSRRSSLPKNVVKDKPPRGPSPSPKINAKVEQPRSASPKISMKEKQSRRSPSPKIDLNDKPPRGSDAKDKSTLPKTDMKEKESRKSSSPKIDVKNKLPKDLLSKIDAKGKTARATSPKIDMKNDLPKAPSSKIGTGKLSVESNSASASNQQDNAPAPSVMKKVRSNSPSIFSLPFAMKKMRSNSPNIDITKAVVRPKTGSESVDGSQYTSLSKKGTSNLAAESNSTSATNQQEQTPASSVKKEVQSNSPKLPPLPFAMKKKRPNSPKIDAMQANDTGSARIDGSQDQAALLASSVTKKAQTNLVQTAMKAAARARSSPICSGGIELPPSTNTLKTKSMLHDVPAEKGALDEVDMHCDRSSSSKPSVGKASIGSSVKRSIRSAKLRPVSIGIFDKMISLKAARSATAEVPSDTPATRIVHDKQEVDANSIDTSKGETVSTKEQNPPKLETLKEETVSTKEQKDPTKLKFSIIEDPMSVELSVFEESRGELSSLKIFIESEREIANQISVETTDLLLRAEDELSVETNYLLLNAQELLDE